MEKKITGNDSANPIAWTENQHILPGLTIRQHYSGLAMQAILSTLEGKTNIDKGMAEHIAKESVLAADHLISELNKS